MGNPLKLRTIKTLHTKVLAYKLRVDRVFGEYDPGDDTYEGDVQRAIENLLDKLEAAVGHLTPKCPSGTTSRPTAWCTTRRCATVSCRTCMEAHHSTTAIWPALRTCIIVRCSRTVNFPLSPSSIRLTIGQSRSPGVRASSKSS